MDGAKFPEPRKESAEPGALTGRFPKLCRLVQRQKVNSGRPTSLTVEERGECTCAARSEWELCRFRADPARLLFAAVSQDRLVKALQNQFSDSHVVAAFIFSISEFDALSRGSASEGGALRPWVGVRCGFWFGSCAVSYL